MNPNVWISGVTPPSNNSQYRSVVVHSGVNGIGTVSVWPDWSDWLDEPLDEVLPACDNYRESIVDGLCLCGCEYDQHADSTIALLLQLQDKLK